jgi:hypothetical protein
MPDSLFDVLPEQLTPQSGNKCKDCKHIQKWKAGNFFSFIAA